MAKLCEQEKFETLKQVYSLDWKKCSLKWRKPQNWLIYISPGARGRTQNFGTHEIFFARIVQWHVQIRKPLSATLALLGKIQKWGKSIMEDFGHGAKNVQKSTFSNMTLLYINRCQILCWITIWIHVCP